MDKQIRGDSLSPENVKKLNDLMKGMRYGTVTIIVQDGKIIQIDKTEKHRL
ncbi:MAG: YezD family protein [Lachnospiraceae bacterium]|nr:YezD family protein [Lachnospiraceae bacterium]MCR5604425.1 YezD family protein [Lachnospiraceae bacterium]